MRTPYPHRLARGHRGTTLIEALITVLVLALAALAYAALQVRGASNNASASWRSQATLMAAELTDRLRGNPVGVAAGSYNNLTTPGSASACSAALPCTPTQMANTDFARWRASLGNLLPGGSGVVCLDSSPNDGSRAAPACDGQGTQLAVKVFWTERGTETRFVTVVRP
ncbi:MAG TPA: type IV pilus modification protein PilV [Burkholderiaceae bacterium]|nr:type IV pilus modification protein PilV [Burkholderiaceae bacterium]HMX09898.1 type IV pilus modification protein PilV [Burkholderiaceae bacterium]HMY98780.1 type IV pilus modification protein PilV [Burkholderiaceae bacterium]HNB43366.1 type IV pilus modification protein PilV [Burkholderiaceae bacterium]HNG78985.1 type IV pilus modification protein PilV [Burkholderiaceae bacterium]